MRNGGAASFGCGGTNASEEGARHRSLQSSLSGALTYLIGANHRNHRSKAGGKSLTFPLTAGLVLTIRGAVTDGHAPGWSDRWFEASVRP
jgi:hypothetical protein